MTFPGLFLIGARNFSTSLILTVQAAELGSMVLIGSKILAAQIKGGYQKS